MRIFQKKADVTALKEQKQNDILPKKHIYKMIV